MTTKVIKYDVGIIGAGVAGCFAALRFSEKLDKKSKIIVFDIGKQFGKRRRQLEGALGVFPNSDGKLYLNNLNSIREKLVDGRTIKGSYNWVIKQLEMSGPLDLIRDSLPNSTAKKGIAELNLSLITNDHFQWKPEYIHKFSKYLVSQLETQFQEEPSNIQFSFDNEVHQILKKKGDEFIISSNGGDIICKKIILCVGRTGFRWVNDFYKEMGMEVSDDVAQFGLRFEISSQYMKDFNRSHCNLVGKNYNISPLSWNGTVIPVDHADLVCSGFRSNEDRWHSEKVSFGLSGNRLFPGGGVAQVERIANLTYLLFNDRVSKERVKTFLKGKSQINLIKEYDWLKEVIEELDSKLFHNLISNGFYHVPYIVCDSGKIKVDEKLCTEISGMFVAGESAGVKGLLGAAVSGVIAADSIIKESDG